MTMFMVAYSARSDSRAVKAPGPATNGNANGTIAALPDGPAFLNMTTSSTISSAIKKMMSAPATANERISTLNSCKIQSNIRII